ncbi:MAG: TetR/AcrR family transcriptional regulator [Thermoleophilaceae bacterium]
MPYRPTQKTEARRLATRERIVAAALARVASGGYASADMQSVARAAGVAVGTVYRHFPSKGDLFAEVFRRASQRELDVVIDVAAADGRSATERVAAAVEAFCRRALAGPVLAYSLIAEPVDPAVESERLRLREGYRDAFARVLEDGVRDGELRPHDSRTVAAALVGALAESLVGPLAGRRATGRAEALIATLVQFCQEAIPRAHERIHA